MAGQTINVSVLADTSKFRRAMSNLGNQTGLSKLAGAARNAGAALAAMAKTAAVAGGAAGAALGLKAISAAGDLEQSIGAVNVVFGRNASKMHTWAAGAASSVGLTRNEFNELGTLIGTQLKNGGTAMDDLAPKTNNLIKLGADLSSMFGGTTRQAIEAISSALKGERDPIEQYGVSLNQASVDAEAARLGFTKIGGSLSTEANQAATLSLIMKQTADAHGNFSRETNTLQHQQQVLKSRLGDMAAEMGTKLLPVATQIVEWASNHVGPAMAGAQKAIEKITPALQTAADGWSAIVSGFQGKAPTVDLGPSTDNIVAAGGKIRQAWDTIWGAMKKVAGFITDSLIPGLASAVSAINEHKLAITLAAAPFLALIGAAKTYQVVLAAVKGVQTGYAAVMGTINALKAAYAWGTYGQITAEQGLLGIQASLLGVMRQKVIWLGKTIASGAKVIASNAAQAASWVAQKAAMLAHAAVAGIVRAGQLAMAAAQWVLNAAMNANPIALVVIALVALGAALVVAWKKSATFRAIVTGAWNAIKAAAVTVGNAFLSVLRSIGSGLSSAISTVKRWGTSIKNSISSAWNSAKNATTRAISAVVSTVKGLPGRAAAALSSLGSRISGTVSRAWNSAKSAASRGVSGVVNAVKGLPNRIISGVGNIRSKVSSIGRHIIDGMVSGIKNAAGRLTSAAKNAVSNAISAAKRRLGIHSPSRVFRTIGTQTIDGMILGLQDRTNRLATAAGRVADTVTTNATPAPTLSITAPQNGTPAQITVNVECLDPTPRVARLIVQTIRDAQRRGVAIA